MRRIVVGALVLVVVTGLAVVLVVLDPWSDGGRKGDPAGGSGKDQNPAQADRRQGVYRIRDARPMVEGEDYRVLHDIPGPIGHKTETVLPDGDLVLVHRYRYSKYGDRLPDLVEVWDPATDERTTVPTVWRGGIRDATATSASDLWLTFGLPRTGQGSRRGLAHYDRDTGETRLITIPHPAAAKSRRHLEFPQVGGDGRIYFITGSNFCYRTRCSTPDDRELWSFDPDRPEEVRREAGNVGYFAASKRLLAWVEPTENIEDDAVDLHIRPAGRAARTVELRDCSDWYAGHPVQATDDLVLLSGCGRVYDARSRLLTELSIYGHDLTGMTDRWIAWGWTIWNPRTGRLLRTADDRIVWHQRPVAMSGDIVVLPSLDGPRNTRNGTWRVVRLQQ